MPSTRVLLASPGSSPDPLSQSTGPTISATPRGKRSPAKRRTTVASTPTKVTATTTSSPWRIRVVVEAERDIDDEMDGGGGDSGVVSSRGRKTRTRTTTTKIPLRGLSPGFLQKGGNTTKRKMTPAKARSGSPRKKKPPTKTPRVRRKSPMVAVEQEEQRHQEEQDEEIMALAEETEVVDKPVEAPERYTRRHRSPANPRIPSARTTRRSAVGTVGSSCVAKGEEESISSNRSALSRRDPNSLLSPTPPIAGSKRLTRESARNIPPPSSPSPPPLVEKEDDGDDDEEEASIEQSEGFSLISTHSLIPGLRDSVQRHTALPTQEEGEGDEDEDGDMELPDFTYISTGTSYTPRVSKKRSLPSDTPEEVLFEDDPVHAESFYGVPIPAGLFRSSPPPEFSRDMITPAAAGGDKTPQLPPRLPEGNGSRNKRMRETPGLDSVLRAGEGLRSSMGTDSSPGMEMRSERFGGALDSDGCAIAVKEGSPSVRVRRGTDLPNGERAKHLIHEAVSYPSLQSGIASPSASEESTKRPDRKEKGKSKAMEKHRRSEAEDMDWIPSVVEPDPSPCKSVRFLHGEHTRILEDIWAQEREEVRKQAMEVGAITIDESPSHTVLLEQKWQEEREEVRRRAQDMCAITIDTTSWEGAGTDDSAMTMAGQDTKAFEESIYNRCKMAEEESVSEKLFPVSVLKKPRAVLGPRGGLAPSSSSSGGRGYRRASSTLGIRGESISSHSSPPPTAPTTLYQPSTREQAIAQTTTGTGTRPPTAAGSNTTNMLPPELLPPLASKTESDTPGWTSTHWKLLETILHSRKTQPPKSSTRRILVSVDDPAKLAVDGLLDDDEVEIVKSRGDIWLRLGVRETYAVHRFLRKHEVKSEGWEERVVAGKVGAIVLASARRRRREEKRIGRGLRGEKV